MICLVNCCRFSPEKSLLIPSPYFTSHDSRSRAPLSKHWLCSLCVLWVFCSLCISYNFFDTLVKLASIRERVCLFQLGLLLSLFVYYNVINIAVHAGNSSGSNKLPNIVVEWVAFKICVLEVLGLNIETQTILAGVWRFPSVAPVIFQDSIANYVTTNFSLILSLDAK